jgi:hypothetical protein
MRPALHTSWQEHWSIIATIGSSAEYTTTLHHFEVGFIPVRFICLLLASELSLPCHKVETANESSPVHVWPFDDHNQGQL